MILFIHIPKTGGTSLRIALEKLSGNAPVAFDYGAQSDKTSDIVQDLIYRGPKKWQIRSLIGELSERDSFMLAGHFPAKRYSQFFPPTKIITMIRDPLSRCASEYLHKTRNKSFDGSFEDFFSEAHNQNVLSRYLEGLPENAFIGITEHYSGSIDVINQNTGLEIRLLKRNVAPKGGARKFLLDLAPDLLNAFSKLNESDIEIYRSRLAQLNTKRDLR